MKLGTALIEGRDTLIAAIGDTGAVTLSAAYQAAGLGAVPASLNDLIEAGPDELSRARGAVETAATNGASMLRVADIDFRPPQPRPTKFMGVAMNNRGIRKEAHKSPTVPNYFLKAPSCLTGHNHPIIMKEHYGETIPELELAAVIGKRAKNVSVEEARDVIFGYSIANDITSHGIKFGYDSIATTRAPELTRPHHFAWRNRHGEDDNDIYFVYHTRSKATDTFGPMGPWITTADEIANPNTLDVRGYFNGEPFAQDNTSNYMFTVEQVIADASEWFTLEPGDIIIFGTTAKGVGKYPHGHREINMHKMNGLIECEIEGLGKLANRVVHEK
jgi:2-keto-4-pentenoate hydratase/2-oxohepta-3-ene-1,7-dioic acid hydratase in catechol pathway